MWHRKAHKTTLAINELLRWAGTVTGTYWYVAPFLNQAKKIVWEDPQMLPKYCPPEIWDNRNNSDLTLKFPNGSILYVLGADKPDSLRGPNPRGVVLDEYGDIKKEIWSGIVQPIMMANPLGWTWFMGTPKGRNDFFTKFNFAKSGANPSWSASLLKASKSGIIRADMLAEAKSTTTQAFFDQEYECEFLESATSFFRGVRKCLYKGEAYPEQGFSYDLGIDLAKYQDWTVITPFCLNDFRVHPQERFNQVDWNIQKSSIAAAYYKHNRARIKIDSTGLGDPIVDDLIAKGIPIDTEKGDNVKFTGGSEGMRRRLLDNLAIQIEQNRIKLPEDEGMLEELEAMQFVLTDRGTIRVQVPDGTHDDRVMSLALAVWDTGDRPIGRPIAADQQDGLQERIDRHSIF